MLAIVSVVVMKFVIVFTVVSPGGLQACNRNTRHETCSPGGCAEPVSISDYLAPAQVHFQEMFRLQNLQGRKSDGGRQMDLRKSLLFL